MSLRPVARRAMRSSQKMPIKRTIIGETSMVDFSEYIKHHLKNVV